MSRLFWRVVVMLVLVPVLLGAQQPVERMRVKGDGVNLRVAPSIDSSIVRSLPKGSLANVIAREGVWAKVQTPSATGWVRSSQLEAVSDPGTVPASSQSQSVSVPSQPSAIPPPATAPPSTRVVTAERGRALPARSDNGPGRRSSIALIGGLTVSQGAFTGPASGDSFGTGLGFSAGFSLSILISGPVGISLDPSFTQRGMSVSNGSATLSLKTGYAELPVQLRLKIGGPRGGVVLSAGGYVARELACRLTRNGGPSGACDKDAGFTDHQKTDFGIAGGLRLNAGRMMIGGRAAIGSRDLYADKSQVGRNRSLVVYTGYRF